MTVRVVQGEENASLIASAVDLLAYVMAANVLGVICQDGAGVFVMPMPMAGREVFAYLATVNWEMAQREAAEFEV